MEATNQQSQSQISEQQRELKHLRERIRELEREREMLAQTNSKLSDQSGEARILREKIELLFKEKAARESEYEAKLVSLAESNERACEKLRLDYEIQREDLVGKYESRLSTERARYEEQVLGLKRDLVKEHNDELSRVVSERAALRGELESWRAESEARTRQAELEIGKLREALSASRIALDEKSALFETLRGEHARTSEDLNASRQTAARQGVTIEQLNSEIARLKELFESTSNDSKREFKVQLELANQQLDAKWKELLR